MRKYKGQSAALVVASHSTYTTELPGMHIAQQPIKWRPAEGLDLTRDHPSCCYPQGTALPLLPTPASCSHRLVLLAPAEMQQEGPMGLSD